jgi:excisionase family DNA binding protein
MKPQPMPSGKRFLSAAETGEYLGLAEGTVRQWASMRKIPFVKLGRSLRFDIRDLEELANANKVNAHEQ